MKCHYINPLFLYCQNISTFLHMFAPRMTFSIFYYSPNHVRYCRCLFLLLFNNCRSFSWKHSSGPILMPNAPWRSIFVKVLSIWLWGEAGSTQGGNVNSTKLSNPQSFGCKATVVNTETSCCFFQNVCSALSQKTKTTLCDLKQPILQECEKYDRNLCDLETQTKISTCGFVDRKCFSFNLRCLVFEWGSFKQSWKLLIVLILQKKKT